MGFLMVECETLNVLCIFGFWLQFLNKFDLSFLFICFVHHRAPRSFYLIWFLSISIDNIEYFAISNVISRTLQQVLSRSCLTRFNETPGENMWTTCIEQGNQFYSFKLQSWIFGWFDTACWHFRFDTPGEQTINNDITFFIYQHPANVTPFHASWERSSVCVTESELNRSATSVIPLLDSETETYTCCQSSRVKI